MRKSILIFMSLVLSIISLAQSEYESKIEKERKEKDLEYKTAEDSPIPNKLKKDFKGLNYFPVDSNFRVKARIVPATDTTSFQMKTTTERLPVYKPWAEAIFTINNQEYSLMMYENVALAASEEYKSYLFLPFNDLTNGVESYGGGRYINLEKTNSDFIIIDFNTCYNPYCSYNAKYSCPIPPDRNNLNILISAGEKNFDKH
jgi:uncharacterized protein (DUF1684 family)